MEHLCCSEVSISPLFRWPNSVNHFNPGGCSLPPFPGGFLPSHSPVVFPVPYACAETATEPARPVRAAKAQETLPETCAGQPPSRAG
ncbi:hypothetical protein D9I71_24360 [Escherichia coli]|uniref:Uncharacterized protein n=1 Tax=Escherichia coli O6 TaxID=217992 RepID=A0AAD2NXX7_ECOLX|nr:hypothetical protein [Escherichia coli]EFA5393391.1 hypothetical protein [Escherichia coli O6]EAC1500469.1 hypothetical protein [Escherichia coli]EEW2457887.1 hypothetical protein [Escherichia coli]EEW2639212.1 hypothetical protein [Escherichia coli]